MGKIQQNGKASRKAEEGRRRAALSPQPRSLLQQFPLGLTAAPEPLTWGAPLFSVSQRPRSRENAPRRGPKAQRPVQALGSHRTPVLADSVPTGPEPPWRQRTRKRAWFQSSAPLRAQGEGPGCPRGPAGGPRPDQPQQAGGRQQAGARQRAGGGSGQEQSWLLLRGRGPLQPPGWRRARWGAAEAQASPGGRPGLRPGLCQAGWAPAPPLHLLGPEESEPTLDLPQQWDPGRDHPRPLGPASCPLDSSAGREERRGLPHLHVGLRGQKEPLQALARWGLGGGHGVKAAGWAGSTRTARSDSRLRVSAESATLQSRRPGSWEPRGHGPGRSAQAWSGGPPAPREAPGLRPHMAPSAAC